MSNHPFDQFRLVGGTSLSLQTGHRLSVAIDLISDTPYGEIDFDQINQNHRTIFPMVSSPTKVPIGYGSSYILGKDQDVNIKLDICYTEPFLENYLTIDGMRLASFAEIGAMKMDVVQRGGRKKDFWDIHELLDRFSLGQYKPCLAQKLVPSQ